MILLKLKRLVVRVRDSLFAPRVVSTATGSSLSSGGSRRTDSGLGNASNKVEMVIPVDPKTMLRLKK